MPQQEERVRTLCLCPGRPESYDPGVGREKQMNSDWVQFLGHPARTPQDCHDHETQGDQGDDATRGRDNMGPWVGVWITKCG